MADKEVRGFQTEVKQMLHLMIHSLYSNKEIFLRELVSNASDAIDRLHFESLDKPELMEGAAKPMIRVTFDRDARTVTVSDDGIGMSREEVIDHLGTIAKSGTKEFFASLTGDRQKDSQLIGQFGVGFYSAFIVGDQVTVVTRRAGTQSATRWQSDGEGEYSLEDAERSAAGTDVIVHMREGEDRFLDSMELREIIRKYSDHICVPIMMNKNDWKDGKEVTSPELERVNSAAALWTRPKAEITDDQYKEFYKHVSHDYEDPLAWVHKKVEGTTEYTQLLYIPQKAPFDLFNPQERHGIKLYVRRVFIMDDAEKLMPMYLRFVRGVVDSSDLPLNVSREILQESRDVRLIREGCTKRVLGLLEDLAKNKAEQYAQFWATFGRVLKEGIGEDPANQKKIAALLRFETTASEGKCSVSLDDYIKRMKEGQKAIYYVTAESQEAAASSPQLEIFRKKGIDVILMGERVDEWMMSFLTEYEGKNFVSIAKGALDLGDLEDKEEAEASKKQAEEFAPLAARCKTALGDKVKEVRVSSRLTDSPVCIVADESDMNRNLERMLRAAGQPVPESKPILEINPKNPLVAHLKDCTDEELGTWTEVLLDQARLADGEPLKDPASFVRRMNALLAKSIG